MGRLARGMDVAPGTLTAMVKSLVASGLVEYQPYTGARLTRSGQKLALRILRRHRVIELFLVEALGMDWSEVHEDAERLEHAASERVVQRMDEFLGSPGFDPHGDPIPTAEGAVEEPDIEPLANMRDGERGRVARVIDQSPAFPRAVEQLGLLPGTTVRVERRDDHADTLQLRLPRKPVFTVAEDVARRLLVQRI